MHFDAGFRYLRFLMAAPVSVPIQDFEEQTDNQLVTLANRGDQAAMETIYFRHREYVFSLAFRFVENREDAADVLQEVFSYFFKKFPGFELKSKLTTFLYPVVKNKSIDLIRKRRKVVSLDGEYTGAIPDKSFNAAAEKVKLAEWLEGLPDGERELLFMRFYDGFKLAEIADILKIPLGTLKSRLHRTLSRLQKNICVLPILLWLIQPPF